ncbi:IclR family transcriptional regulator [Microbacterium sediminicola]|uniref:IclR family transcriptional regulator n=1 Tax=Microbacterium sediminicola TaxID=415210 RepID=A0ABN2I0F7_9MICO
MTTAAEGRDGKIVAFGPARSGATDSPDPSSSKRTAAARVLALLGAFGHGTGALTLTEISRQAQLSLTTTHRIAREVVEWGGLEIDESGRYRLSRKILDLASASTEDLQVRERALPHLVDLHRRTGLTVHLGVRDGRDVMYLEALRAHPNYSGENRLGGRLRLHVTATGLALLAYAGEDFISDYVAEPLKRYTPHTVVDPDELTALLRRIRTDRYVHVRQFVTMGTGVVAAPVFAPDGTAKAAVGVVYLIERDDPDHLVEPVRLIATRITQSLAETRTTPDPRTIDFNRRHAGLV